MTISKTRVVRRVVWETGASHVVREDGLPPLSMPGADFRVAPSPCCCIDAAQDRSSFAVSFPQLSLQVHATTVAVNARLAESIRSVATRCA